MGCCQVLRCSSAVTDCSLQVLCSSDGPWSSVYGPWSMVQPGPTARDAPGSGPQAQGTRPGLTARAPNHKLAWAAACGWASSWIRRARCKTRGPSKLLQASAFSSCVAPSLAGASVVTTAATDDGAASGLTTDNTTASTQAHTRAHAHADQTRLPSLRAAHLNRPPPAARRAHCAPRPLARLAGCMRSPVAPSSQHRDIEP